MKYITGIPNRGAGIGHAFVDWARAFSLAKNHSTSFLYSPFSGCNEHWDTILGLGFGYAKYNESDFDLLLSPEDCSFQEYVNDAHLSSYESIYVIDGNLCYPKLVSSPSYDDLSRFLRSRYLLARRRRPIFSAFKPDYIKVAVHIRRGNITEYEQFASRVIPNDYYLNVLTRLLELCSPSVIDIVVVSNAIDADLFDALSRLNARFVNTRSDIHDFHVLASSDILVTSVSGFSYLATLINLKAMKIVPEGFWHEWPDGSFTMNQLDTPQFHASLQILKSKAITRKHTFSGNRGLPRWDHPSIRLSGESLRSRLIDNAAMKICTVKADGADNGEIFRADILTRKFLGAIIDCGSLELSLARQLPGFDHILKDPCAYIDYSLVDISAHNLRAVLMRYMARHLCEALIGRKIILPSSSCINIGDILSSGFHPTTSCLSIHSGLIFCSDLIAIKIKPSLSSL